MTSACRRVAPRSLSLLAATLLLGILGTVVGSGQRPAQAAPSAAVTPLTAEPAAPGVTSISAGSATSPAG